MKLECLKAPPLWLDLAEQSFICKILIIKLHLSLLAEVFNARGRCVAVVVVVAAAEIEARKICRVA